MAEADLHPSSSGAWLTEDYESDEEDFWCSVCQKLFSGPIPFLQHEKGAGHRKALLRKIDKEGIPQVVLECSTCQKEIPADAWESHIKGKPHKKAEAALRLLKQLKKGNISKEALHSDEILNTTSNNESSSQEDEYDEQEFHTKVFECNECGKAFTGVEPYYNHLISPAHEKVLKQQQQLHDLSEAHPQHLKLHEDGTLVCFICKAAFSGPESAKAHLKGKGHRKKEELIRWRRERRAHSKEEKPQEAEVAPRIIEVDLQNISLEDDEAAGENLQEEKSDVWV